MTTEKTPIFQQFFKTFTPREYKPGEILIRADDDPQGIFCLTDGYVRQFIISKNGMELTLQILRPVAYFPKLWAFNGVANMYNYEAITEVQVGRAPREEVMDFIQDKPALLLSLMSELLDDYAESLKRIEHLVFSDAYRRVISILIYIANNFGKKSKGKFVVAHYFTHEDIAALVGVARETASIELSKLTKAGLVLLIDQVMEFPDLQRLEQELLADPSSRS